MEDLGDDVLRRLQDSILLRIRDLAHRGLVAAPWATVEMLFHDPQAGAARPPAAPSSG